MIRADGQLTSHAGLVPSICPPYVFASPNFTPWYGEASQWFKETCSASPPAAVMVVMAMGIEPRLPVYKPCLLTTTLPWLTSIDMDDESTEHTNSTWTLFSHTGMYVTAIGSLIPAGLGLFCCYVFWCWPARSVYQPLQPGNMQYTIVDDDVEVAPIYRCDGKVSQPTRPHENHGLAIEHLPTWMESQCKQQLKSLVVPVHYIIGKFIQNPGNTEMYITSAARLRLAPCTTTTTLRIDRWMHNNSWSMTLPFDV